MGAKKKATYPYSREQWAHVMRGLLRDLFVECDRGIRRGWLTDDARAMLKMRGLRIVFDRHEAKAKRLAGKR
jgi:hypothetical protein